MPARAILSLFIAFATSMTTGCAYKLSNTVDSLPGKTKSLYIPVFKNTSTEPGVEVYFTNALKKEILTSKSATLFNEEAEADSSLNGEIKSVEVFSDESVNVAENTKYLPSGTVISTQVKVVVTVSLSLKRKNSTEVLWRSDFKQSLNYTPPQVTLPVIN